MRLLHGEDERVGDFEHREGKREQAASHHVRGDEREGDAAQGAQRRAAEILRGFFERDAGLLKARDGGAHDVRQAADGVGDDEQASGIFRGIEEGEGASILRHGDVAEGEDEAGHGEREHGHRVEDAASGKICADDDVGDGDAEDDVHDGGGARVFQAVDDGRDGEAVAERDVEMLRGPSRWKDGAIPLAREGHEHDARVRQEREQGDSGEHASAQYSAEETGRACAARRGRFRHHRVATAAECGLAQQIKQHGRNEHDHH